MASNYLNQSNIAVEVDILQDATITQNDLNGKTLTFTNSGVSINMATNIYGEFAIVSSGSQGKITISNVTGDLEITITETANTYTVTWSDEDNAVDDNKQVATVTHGNDITFDVPANQAPVGTTPGYKYTVTVTETADTTKTIIKQHFSEYNEH